MALSIQTSMTMVMAMALTGCSYGVAATHKDGTGASVTVAKDPKDANCAPAVTSPFIRLAKSDEVGVAIQKASHATNLIWLAPGQPMTRDFRPNRVRVLHDMDGFITAIMCG